MELRADCYGVRLNLFTVQVTIIEVSPHPESFKDFAIAQRTLYLAFVHHIINFHVQIVAADILCPANSSQTQQAAYKKQLFHRITDLLVW